MDFLPSLSSIDENPKDRFKNNRADKDDDSICTSRMADNFSGSVNFVALQTSRVKLASKKAVEPSKKLKKRLQQISDENASLAKLIDDKNMEIEDLKQSVQSLNDVLESVPIEELRSNSSIASNKILDLNKKNRQLRAELEVKKSQLSKRDIQIQKLEKELKELTEKLERSCGEKNNMAITELQGKFNALQQKLFETRNKNVELQEKLKLAGKCLTQEIGDSFDLGKLNTMAAQGTSNWRGRAQQIIHLQQTINELKSRIEELEVNQKNVGSSSSTNASTSDFMSLDDAKDFRSSHPRSMKSAMSFDRLAPSVRRSEIVHRAKVEELEKTITDFKSQIEEQKTKVLALKVRNKNLNEELIKYRARLNELDEHGDFSGINLATLNDKIRIQKLEYENRLEAIDNELKEYRNRCKDLNAREEELNDKLANAESLLTKRSVYIDELEEANKKLEEDMKAICGEFLFSCRELRKEEFVAILDSLETEKNYLLEQNNALDMRLTEERKRVDSLSDQLGKQKMRNTRLDGKVRDLERELESSGKKKERLQRISDYTSNLSAKGSTSSFIFENTQRSIAPVSSSDDTNKQIFDLKNRLELASEKIAMLENRVTLLNNEKEQDRQVYKSTILNTRQAILDTILNYRGEKDSACNSSEGFGFINGSSSSEIMDCSNSELSSMQ